MADELLVTAGEFRDEYPDLSEVPEVILTRELARSQRHLEPNGWGNDLEYAIVLYTAHKFELKYRSQVKMGTAIKALKEGKSIDSHLDLGEKNTQSSLHLTPSGKLFLELEKGQTGTLMFSV